MDRQKYINYLRSQMFSQQLKNTCTITLYIDTQRLRVWILLSLLVLRLKESLQLRPSRQTPNHLKRYQHPIIVELHSIRSIVAQRRKYQLLILMLQLLSDTRTSTATSNALSDFDSQAVLAVPLRWDLQKTAQCTFEDSLLAILQLILEGQNKSQHNLKGILDKCLDGAVKFCNAYNNPPLSQKDPRDRRDVVRSQLLHTALSDQYVYALQFQPKN